MDPAEVYATQSITIVRVKRKRDAEALSDLVVDGLAAPQFKRTAISDLLSQLNVERQGNSSRRMLFKRVTSVSSEAFEAHQKRSRLDSLLNEAGTSIRPTRDPASDSCSPLPRTAPLPSLQYLGKQSLPSATTPVLMYNVLMNHQPEGSSCAHPAPPAPAQHAEQQLLCNGEPMQRRSVAQHALEDTNTSAGLDSVSGEEGSGGDEGDYVYDLYTLAEDQEDEVWMEAAAERVALVQITDDGEWLVYADEDDGDDDADSQDSNAEDYYANSYPDEDEWGSEDEGLGGYHQREAYQSDGSARGRYGGDDYFDADDC